MEKFGEREKDFGKKKKISQSSEEVVCLAKKENNKAHDYSRERGGRRRRGKKNNRGKGANIIKDEYFIFIAYDVTKMVMMLPHASSLGTKSNKKEMKRKENHSI